MISALPLLSSISRRSVGIRTRYWPLAICPAHNRKIMVCVSNTQGIVYSSPGEVLLTWYPPEPEQTRIYEHVCETLARDMTGVVGRDIDHNNDVSYVLRGFGSCDGTPLTLSIFIWLLRSRKLAALDSLLVWTYFWSFSLLSSIVRLFLSARV